MTDRQTDDGRATANSERELTANVNVNSRSLKI